MNLYETIEFKKALEAAFVQAIEKIGFHEFKKISWFASNERSKE